MIFWTDVFDPQVTYCMNSILVFDSFGEKKPPGIVSSYGFECENVLVDRVGTNRKFVIIRFRMLFQKGFFKKVLALLWLCSL